MSISAKLKEMGITLPQVVTPLAAYVPAVRSGNMIYVSGQVPMVEGKLFATGRLGDTVSIEDGAAAARVCALNGLAAAAALVDLDKIARIVKVTGFVASTPDFYDHPKVVNGASELLGEIFGEKGKHARAAVGMAALPLNAPVEVEMIVEVEE